MNWTKRALALLGMALLVVGLVACGGAEDRKAKYLQRGKALFEQGNYVKAKLEFKNVLQIDPKDVEALYMLGQMAEREQAWKQAFGAYSQVLQLDPAHVAARVRLGNILLLSGAADKALGAAEAALKAEPDNVDALVLRSAARFKQGDPDGAFADARAAVKADPANRNAVSMLASLYAEQGDVARALSLAEEASSKYPDDLNLRMLLVRLYDLKGDQATAADMLRQMVVLQPENLVLRGRLAGYLLAQKRPDEAEKVLRDAVEALPESLEAKLALVEFLARQRSPAAAETVLQGFVDTSPAMDRLRFAQVDLYQAMRRPERMQTVLRQIVARDGRGPNGLKARDRLAGLLFVEGKLDAAGRLVDEVLAESPQDSGALLIRGGIALARKQADAAVADLRAVLKNDPGSARALRLLARAYLLKGDVDMARESLKKAVQTNPKETQSNLELAQLLAQSGDADGAVSVLKTLVEQNPGDFAAAQALTKLYIARKAWPEATAAAARLKERHADRAEGYYLSGLVLQNQGELEESVQEFDAALARLPEAVQPLVAVTRSYLALKQPERALERIEQAIHANPSNPVARNLKGEILVGLKRFDAAQRAFDTAKALKPEWPAPYGNLGRVYLAQRQATKAIEVLREGVAATTDNSVLGIQLGTLLDQQGDARGAIALYEKLLAKQPQALVLANNLAMLLSREGADRSDLDRALELARQFERSNSPVYLDTLGWVYYRRGETGKAVEVLKTVVEQAPDVPVFHYHLGLAYKRAGNTVAAKKALQAALDANADFPEKQKAEALLSTL